MSKSEMINLNAPYELGEYKDIQIRVFLPKSAEEKGIYLGNERVLTLVMCKRLNEYYNGKFKDKYGEDKQLWFKPTKKVCEDD